MQHYR